MRTIKQLFLFLIILAIFAIPFIKPSHATVTVQLSDKNGSDSFNVINSGTISVFNILSNGRVGIGTTTPSAMLCIEGSSTVSSTALCITGTVTVVGSFNASSYSGDGSGLTGISSSAIASNIEFQTTGSITAGTGISLSNNKFAVDSNGSLTASTITTGGSVTADSIISSGSITGGDITSSGTLTVSGNLFLDSPTLVVDSVNNRVGVGTTTPQVKLDVNGTISATSITTGNITATGGNVVADSFAGDGSQLTGITNDSFATNIEIVTTGSITAGLGLALANKTFVVDSTGSMTASTVISNGAVTGQSFNNAGNSFSVNSNGVLTSAQLSTTNNNFVVDSAGSLTTAVLTVTGSVTAKGDIITNGAVTAAGNLAIDGTTLFVDSANNRVGIGTTTPGTQLHLVGNDTWLIPSSSTEGLVVKQEGSGPIAAFRTTTATAFRIENNNNAWFFGGNVGVGTTTPSQKLVVDGAFVATSVTADSIAVTNGTITANSFVGNGSSVTGIVSAGITNNTIATVDIADGAISSAKILDGQVQGADLQSGISINAGSLTAQIITTIGSVTATKFAISGDRFVVDSFGSITAASITSTGSVTVAGSVIATGTISSSSSLKVGNSALLVNATTDKTGIGTTTPAVQVHIVGGTLNSSARLALQNTSADEANVSFTTPQGNSFIVAAGAAGEGWTGSSAGDMILTNRTGGKLSLTADTTQALAPVNILSTNAIALGTITSPISVVTIQGSSSVQLALDVRGTTSVTGGFVGIGTNAPSTELEVVGTLTATSFSGGFSGDGSNLTGITNSSLVNNIEIVTSGSITAGLGLALSNRTFVVDSTGSVTASDIKSTGTLTASRISASGGSFTVDTVGSMTASHITSTGSLTASSITVSSGTITAAFFSGDGSSLTNLSSGTVSAASLSSRELATDSVGSDEIATDAVGSTEIAQDAVTASEIAAGAVDSSEIAANAVAASEIATGAVATAEILDRTIGTNDLSTSLDFVTTGTLSVASGNFTVNSAGSVTASVLDMSGFDVDSAGSITATSITAGTITVSGGTITAGFFSGDGSGLTNLSATVTAASLSSLELATDSVGSDEIATDAVGSTEIAQDAVTASEIAAGAVDSSEIAANAVAASEIATGAVATAEILDRTIGTDDLSTSLDFVTTGTLSVASGNFTVNSAGSVTASVLDMSGFDVDSAGSITATSITAGTITVSGGTITAGFFSGDGSGLTNLSATVTAGSLSSLELATNSVGSDEIATDAVGSTEIAQDAVTASEIAAGAVDSSEIAANAVAASEIATGAVATAEILDRTIGTDDLSTSLDFVTTGTLSVGNDVLTVGSANVGVGTSTPSTLLHVDGTVTALGLTMGTSSSLSYKMPNVRGSSGQVLTAQSSGVVLWVDAANGTVSAASLSQRELAADSVSSDEIATDAVGNTEIAQDAVTASEIAAGAVDSSEIAANAVAASEIATGAVATAEILDRTIGTDDLSTSLDFVTTGTLSVGSDVLTVGSANVGVGTSTPSTLLHVDGTVTALGLTMGTSSSLSYKMPNVRGSSGQVLTAQSSGVVLWVDAANGTVSAASLSQRELAADSVSSDEIATDAVGSTEIAQDAVTASEIAAGAVDSSEIAANAVAASEIATGAVATAEILDRTIGTNDLSTSLDFVTTGTLSVGSDVLTVGSANVGVGTSTPVTLLHVDGTTTVLGLTMGTSTSLKYSMPNVRGSSGQVLTAQSSGIVLWVDAASTSIWPAINNGSSTVFTNIAIGTQTRTTELQVGGTATVEGLQIGTMKFPEKDGSSGQVLRTDASGTLSWGDASVSNDSVTTSKILDHTITTDDFSASLDFVTTGTLSIGSDILTVGSQFVGIGTSTPSTELQINGTATMLGLTMGTSSSSKYKLPNVRGTSGQVLTAGGGTNVKWVDISVGSSQISTGAVTTSEILDHTITTDDFSASLDFVTTGTLAVGSAILTVGSDKVGIGTSTPSTKLQVNGTITALGLKIGTSSSLTYSMPNVRGSNGQVLTAGSSGAVIWEDASGGASIWPSISDGSSTVFTNVAVGTQTVSTALTIGGTATVEGLQIGPLKFPNSDGTSGQVLSTDASGNLSWASSGGGSDAFPNILNGSVTTTTRLGVGTNTMSSDTSIALDVNGTTTIHGNLDVTGYINMGITEVSSNTTLSTGNQIVIISSAVTLTLPATPRTGQLLVLLATNTGASLALNGKGVYLSSGNPNITTDGTFASIWGLFTMTIVYDGTKWYIIASKGI